MNLIAVHAMETELFIRSEGLFLSLKALRENLDPVRRQTYHGY